MNVGTKSILFGVHQFAIHPWFVSAAWMRLFGFPVDPRIWVAFFVHDLGYWGKPNMDGPEGETHVELGARIMGFLFDRAKPDGYRIGKVLGTRRWLDEHHRWYRFCLYHSRFYAKRDDEQFSRLCVADKYAIVITPWWLYRILANLSGEIREYMKLYGRTNGSGQPEKYNADATNFETQEDWYRSVQAYVADWVEVHKDGRVDTWTPTSRQEAECGKGVGR